jgi:hypothetical protein
MAKDILAFFGLLFLTLLIVLLVAVVGYYYDALGLVKLPEVVPTTMARVLGPREVTLQAVGIGDAEWSNPLDALPIATWAPSATPRPTSTPVRPLDPAEYRTEVILHLKGFVGGLERWLDANRRLGQDSTLLDDPDWRVEMNGLLVRIGDSGRAMAAVGPAPAEYQGIARLLTRVQDASSALQTNYGRALETRSPDDFLQAGADFERIKAYLTEVVAAMVAQGWSIE